MSAGSTDPREHLAQYLVEQRVLGLHRAAEAYAQSGQNGMPLGKFLASWGVPEPLITQVLIHKAREEFIDCYTWESGDVEWLPDTMHASGLTVNLKLFKLHQDAAAVWREWRMFDHLFPDRAVHFDVVSPGSAQVNPEETALLHRMAAGESLDELLYDERHRLATARLVLSLTQRGLAVPREKELGKHAQGFGKATSVRLGLGSLLETARRAMTDGDYARAVRLSARALEIAPVPEAERLYAEAEQRLKEERRQQLAALDVQLHVRPAPTESLNEPFMADVTPADLFLHSVLLSEGSILKAMQATSFSELVVFEALVRLTSAGLVYFQETSPQLA